MLSDRGNEERPPPLFLRGPVDDFEGFLRSSRDLSRMEDMLEGFGVGRADR